ncbi:Organic hydroperoxide reductase OsmC/OhrA [Paramicrobacterium humi]|uniref:Organic hydroperoxide reductase OsmC/OhrA n=1 Tax=Paramicrobacterium humi TaxID=640635 RepID=A0A1H4PF60_9MICO|nr:OsmC family protein [Microbacterium humi]SEC06067.1 Organic hydroperoxide reductase OsmC/OhrA [Microbacterium humi]
MLGRHSYRVGIEWTGNRGSGTSGYRDYGRQLVVRADGKHDIAASADRTFHGDADRWNPEEMLLTALAQCHMLSYLHAAVRGGVLVTAYTDEPTGTLQEDGKGGGAFTEVVLRPVVTIADASMTDAAEAAHELAHRLCFIANSVNFPVRVEPSVCAAS